MVSTKCASRLEGAPLCDNTRALRSRMMCLAWKMVDEGTSNIGEAISKASQELKAQCAVESTRSKM